MYRTPANHFKPHPSFSNILAAGEQAPASRWMSLPSRICDPCRVQAPASITLYRRPAGLNTWVLLRIFSPPATKSAILTISTPREPLQISLRVISPTEIAINPRFAGLMVWEEDFGGSNSSSAARRRVGPWVFSRLGCFFQAHSELQPGSNGALSARLLH
ncbi:hypothetical protein C8R44DRAFT_736244 [Mycena epipterygia]|nr:hypothetical protein C8R44DRAFT_736244 [Mycena epipterygia]